MDFSGCPEFHLHSQKVRAAGLMQEANISVLNAYDPANLICSESLDDSAVYPRCEVNAKLQAKLGGALGGDL